MKPKVIFISALFLQLSAYAKEIKCQSIADPSLSAVNLGTFDHPKYSKSDANSDGKIIFSKDTRGVLQRLMSKKLPEVAVSVEESDRNGSVMTLAPTDQHGSRDFDSYEVYYDPKTCALLDFICIPNRPLDYKSNSNAGPSAGAFDAVEVPADECNGYYKFGALSFTDKSSGKLVSAANKCWKQTAKLCDLYKAFIQAPSAQSTKQGKQPSATGGAHQ